MKNFLKILFVSLFLISIYPFYPVEVLAEARCSARADWSCQDPTPTAREGLTDGPCDTAVPCPTSGYKCCPSVAVQRNALAAYEEGRTKEAAGDRAGACESFRQAQTMLPSSTIERAITRVCETAPVEDTPTAPAGAPEKVKLENPLGGGAGVTSVPRLIGNIIKTILTIVGALALGMFVFGGFTWMTSGGSSEKIQKGKNILIWAVIGLVVIFTSYTAVDFVLTAFGI